MDWRFRTDSRLKIWFLIKVLIVNREIVKKRLFFKEATRKAKFQGLDKARMGRLQKREEIRTGSIFGANSKMDEEVQKLKKKMGTLPPATRKLLKAQMKVVSRKKITFNIKIS